ncbi:hypothetical protein E2C01_079270 [Portunus trituberculatus]|uniref:Uncharacterized protein n=1 Tax=Portunus trituberculatus TaxID=210409 RepID=A0A5B7IGJ0_PORTR|nr:hypothetical protein [Portunus trituberculatus]
MILPRQPPQRPPLVARGRRCREELSGEFCFLKAVSPPQLLLLPITSSPPTATTSSTSNTDVY